MPLKKTSRWSGSTPTCATSNGPSPSTSPSTCTRRAATSMIRRMIGAWRANFFAALKPGGRFVMELMGREVIACGFQPRSWHELEDGTLWLEERTLVDHWRSIRNRWIIVRGGQRSEFEFTLRTYAASELLDLLRATGFTDTVAYGSLEGIPYDQDAKRLVIVATK